MEMKMKMKNDKIQASKTPRQDLKIRKNMMSPSEMASAPSFVVIGAGDQQNREACESIKEGVARKGGGR